MLIPAIRDVFAHLHSAGLLLPSAPHPLVAVLSENLIRLGSRIVG